MKRSITVILIAALLIAAIIGATAFKRWFDRERWGWYDAGYDDAYEDLGLVRLNGALYWQDEDHEIPLDCTEITY